MRIATTAAIALILLGTSAHAQEWRLGVAYASGVNDVTDLYEENLRLAGFEADVDLKFPIGVTAGFSYDWESGIRADVGLGPVFFIGGDIRHFELPLTGTIGYNFMRLSRVSPYVRGGFTHHFASGDQYSSSDPGLLVAAGLDFARFSVELSADFSKVEFDTLVCDAQGADCTLGTRKLSTYDIIASFFWKFR